MAFRSIVPRTYPVLLPSTKGSAISPADFPDQTRVTLGIDTHKDNHVAIALDQHGRKLGSPSFPSTSSGNNQLLTWSSSLGRIHAAGVEGTGSYGASIARFLRSKDITVVEVLRPNRQHRRSVGKSDPTDAESAARSVLAGTYIGTPKSYDGHVEMLRTLIVVRRSALKARTQIANQLHALLVTAPDELRFQLSPLPISALTARCSRFRICEPLQTPLEGYRLALKVLSKRHRYISTETSALQANISAVVRNASPDLLSVYGVGPDTAASVLLAVGDNPQRLYSESSFAHLCGAAPIPASSGKITRHRLNRGGNRDANRALHIIALARMSGDPRTKAYVAKRTADGKSKKEIIRCLKRYICREIYKVLKN